MHLAIDERLHPSLRQFLEADTPETAKISVRAARNLCKLIADEQLIVYRAVTKGGTIRPDSVLIETAVKQKWAKLEARHPLERVIEAKPSTLRALLIRRLSAGIRELGPFLDQPRGYLLSGAEDDTISALLQRMQGVRAQVASLKQAVEGHD